jgi:LPS O-antigen subunit length determinant protein (WzzB/FepE family)
MNTKIDQITSSGLPVLVFDKNGVKTDLSSSLLQKINFTDTLISFDIESGEKQKLIILNLGYNLNLQINLLKDSLLEIFFFGFYSQQNNLEFNLTGQGSALMLQGFSELENTDLQSAIVNINHLNSNTKSNSLLKNTLSQHSKLNLKTTIAVSNGLQRVDANIQIKSLKLSSSSHISVTPELKIDTKDVKCTHGNSISTLDENQIFYLTSRGVNYSTALEIVAEGFSADILDQV